MLIRDYVVTNKFEVNLNTDLVFYTNVAHFLRFEQFEFNSHSFLNFLFNFGLLRRRIKSPEEVKSPKEN